MLIFPVSKEKSDALKHRMKSLNISESEIIENFIRGSGPGGQKINKTSSCVQIIHKISDIEIKCQKTRSQGLNRYYARILLCEAIEEAIYKKESAKQKAIDKLKRQKRKRSKRAKDKILKEKKHISNKKLTRKKPE